jgi:hypothetical protein
MSNGNGRGPGPARRALFQDVPYILDSLWRRTEFKANRIGHVDFENTHALVLRPAWLSGAFILYVLVSVYCVFGPTLDAMCSVDSTDFARNFRVVIVVVLALAALWVFIGTINSATFHLARKGFELANAAFAADAALRGRYPAPLEAAAAAETAARTATRSFASRAAENIYGNAARLIATFRYLAGAEVRALVYATLLLAAGAVVLISPIGAAIWALYAVEVDPQSCVEVGNRGLVNAQLGALALLLAGGAGAFWRWGKTSGFALLCALCVLLAAVIGLLWRFAAAPGLSEAAGGFYPHVYVILTGTLLVIALLARGFACLMFRRFSGRSRVKLRRAVNGQDLLTNLRDAPDVSGLRLWSALVSGVAQHLRHFLLLPAFVAFIAPTPLLYWLTFAFVIVSIVLLMYGSLSSRWEQMLVYVDRWFLVGTPLIVSIFVIAIAVARLAGVQYVATVIDATPIGVLFIIVSMLYVAVWFFEYWINRWLGEELLASVAPRAAARLGYVHCETPDPPPFSSWARPDGRYIALHGTGRLCAHGWYERAHPLPGDESRGCAFTTYSFAEFFTRLTAQIGGGEILAHEVRRRIALYFNVMNLSLILAMGGLVAWHLNWSKPLVVKPMVDVVSAQAQPVYAAQQQAPPSAAPDILADRLRAQAASGRPAIVVAASGGGTRAAVYTAVALEGMAKIDHARDVVLLSGVSGGGVSSAVFASRFPSLSATPPSGGVRDGNAWTDYVEGVGEPFIQDVLEGVGELRIVGATSLGALLQESLQRRVFNDRDPAKARAIAQSFADPRVPPLILNTAISGHPYDDSEVLAGRVSSPPSDASCVVKSRPYANLAGGRLIFTNLTNTTHFPQPMPDVPDMWLPYRIVNFGDVKLSAASALTANFPPVFSNARVRIRPLPEDAARGECARSYFVTDGGATENLGLVSALYALRSTLSDMDVGTPLSDIHVLALEASAIDYDYSDDRGVGAATGGAKERINAGLTQVLLREVQSLADRRFHAQVHVHYLPLPVAFRSRGGFGTHWMFAPNVRVSNPHLPRKPDNSILPWVTPRDQVDLAKPEVMVLMRALFDPADPVCMRSDRIDTDPSNPANAKYYETGWTTQVQRVARWICGHDDAGRPDAPNADYQVDEWRRVLDALGPESP